MADDEVKRQPFRFVDPRQKRIHRRLAIVGQGPAAFYKDAAHLMSEPLLHVSTTHLVGHLLREIESGLRAVLQTTSADATTTGEDGHKTSIRIILKELEIPETHPVAEAWLRLAGRGDDSLHGIAHRDALSEPRPVDDEFIKFWDRMESILDVVLDRLEANYTAWIPKIDQLAQKATPTASDVQFLKNRLPNNPITLGHFFNKLNSSAWLQPLNSGDLFKQPPPPEYDLEKGTIRFAMWAQSRYLARMAPLDPQAVCEIIAAIPETKNFRVHADYADATLEMPPQVAKALVPKMKQWIGEAQGFVLVPVKLGQLMRLFAANGETNASLELARSLLGFTADSGDPSKESAARRQPSPRFELWYYEQILTQHYPTVVEKAGPAALSLLCDLLEEAIDLGYLPGAKRYAEDYSGIWLPSMDVPVQRGVDAKPYLALAIRDAAITLVGSGSATLTDVLAAFRKRRKKIFLRLAHYLLMMLPDVAPTAIERTLLSRGLLNKARNWHEYTLMVRTCFKRLSPQSQDQFLALIDKGPYTAKMRRLYEGHYQKAATEPEVEVWVTTWKRERIDLVSNDLPAPWKEQFAAVTAPVDPAEQLDAVNKTRRVVYGATGSPDEAMDLPKLSVEEVVTLLKTWKPSGEWMSPTADGLARDVARAVTADPIRFAFAADKFEGLQPIYIQGLIGGFDEALKKDVIFEWSKLLQLCEWTAKQTSAPSAHPAKRDGEEDWNWTRISIARLLSSAFEAKENRIPFAHRQAVWKVLEKLVTTPPTIEIMGETTITTAQVSKSGGSIVDSPEPVLATIRYATWVRQNLEKQSSEGANDTRWLAHMPEVTSLLNSRLALGTKAPILAHSVFGEELGRLFQLDQDWVSQQLPNIFPDFPETKELFNGAWTSYLFHWNPGVPLFELLRGQYMTAIQRQGEPSSKARPSRDPTERLAEHLMFMYYWGKLNLQDELILEFYTKSSDKIRGHALHYLGYSLYSEKGPIAPEILERVRALCDVRLAAIKNATDKSVHQSELAAFGWWFASAKFDDTWSLSHLIEVLGSSQGIEVDHLVVERLAQLSKVMPEECVESIRLLSESTIEIAEIYGWQEHGRTVLSESMSSESENARSAAITLINRLEARGFSGFGDLLPPKKS